MVAATSIAEIFVANRELFVPFAAEQVSVSALLSWLVGAAAIAFVSSDTPWVSWQSFGPGWIPHTVLGIVFLCIVTGAGFAIELLVETSITLGWLGTVGVFWIGLAITNRPETAWAPAMVALAANLMLDFQLGPRTAGFEVYRWFDSDLRSSWVVAVPMLLALTGLMAMAARFPSRQTHLNGGAPVR